MRVTLTERRPKHDESQLAFDFSAGANPDRVASGPKVLAPKSTTAKSVGPEPKTKTKIKQEKPLVTWYGKLLYGPETVYLETRAKSDKQARVYLMHKLAVRHGLSHGVVAAKMRPLENTIFVQRTPFK